MLTYAKDSAVLESIVKAINAIIGYINNKDNKTPIPGLSEENIEMKPEAPERATVIHGKVVVPRKIVVPYLLPLSSDRENGRDGPIIKYVVYKIIEKKLKREV